MTRKEAAGAQSRERKKFVVFKRGANGGVAKTFEISREANGGAAKNF